MSWNTGQWFCFVDNTVQIFDSHYLPVAITYVILFQNTKKMIPEPQKPKKSKESFEQVSLYTAIMTYLGFYLLMFLGYINRLFFIPKVAKEKSNREVCHTFIISVKDQFSYKCQ